MWRPSATVNVIYSGALVRVAVVFNATVGVGWRIKGGITRKTKEGRVNTSQQNGAEGMGVNPPARGLLAAAYQRHSQKKGLRNSAESKG